MKMSDEHGSLSSNKEFPSFTDDIHSRGVVNSTNVTMTTNPVPMETSRYRWLILGLYCLTKFSTVVIFITFFTIADVICRFYRIKEYQLTWSSNAFLFIQTIFTIPSGYLSATNGIRKTMLIGSGLNAVSASIFLAGVHRGGFGFFLAALVITSLSFTISQPLSPQISLIWFRERERAFATSMAIIVGPTLGSVFAFLLPITVFNDATLNRDMVYVQKCLLIVIGCLVGVSMVLFISMCLLVKDKPSESPPRCDSSDDKSQSNNLESNIPGPRLSFRLSEFFCNLKTLFKNYNFHLAINSAAISAAIFFCLPAIANQLLSWKFADQGEVIGLFGITTVLATLIGSVIIGKIADYKRKLKVTALVSMAVSIAAWMIFTQSLIRWLYLPLIFSSAALSCSMGSYGGIIAEMVVEMTHPIPPPVSFSILSTLMMTYSILFMFLVGWMIHLQLYAVILYGFGGLFVLSFLLLLPTRTRTGDQQAASETLLPNA